MILVAFGKEVVRAVVIFRVLNCESDEVFETLDCFLANLFSFFVLRLEFWPFEYEVSCSFESFVFSEVANVLAYRLVVGTSYACSFVESFGISKSICGNLLASSLVVVSGSSEAVEEFCLNRCDAVLV